MALCPFHANTVTPALSIYQKGGRWRYRCHSCGAAGDAIEWVAARDGITMADTLSGKFMPFA
jgi:DNA primase